MPYEPLGCFSEPPLERALNELILDDVDPNSPVFSGIVPSDFADWEAYVKQLICRCARKIKEKRYTTFAISNEGESFKEMGVNICSLLHLKAEKHIGNIKVRH